MALSSAAPSLPDAPGGSSAASLRIKLVDGMDDYCYVFIVLQYSNMTLKEVCLSTLSVLPVSLAV